MEYLIFITLFALIGLSYIFYRVKDLEKRFSCNFKNDFYEFTNQLEYLSDKIAELESVMIDIKYYVVEKSYKE